MEEPGRKIAAWAVHLLTASGAVWGLLALVAISDGRFKAALGWMVLAVVVDTLDGPLARRVQVARVLPSFDGPLLDNLIDYLNYVIVPAYLLYEASLLPAAFGLVGAAMICVASAFQFSQADAKTADHHFKGFPSYWNLLAFYLLVLRPGPWIGFVLVVVLCVLVFVPVRYIYPTRTREYRTLTLILTGVWAVSVLVLLLQYPDAKRWLAYGSLLYVVYYTGLSLKLNARRATGA